MTVLALPFKAPIKVAAVTVSPTCNFFAIPTPPVTISAPIVEAVLSVSDHNLTLPVVRLIVNVLLPDTLSSCLLILNVLPAQSCIALITALL